MDVISKVIIKAISLSSSSNIWSSFSIEYVNWLISKKNGKVCCKCWPNEEFIEIFK